MGQLVRSVPGGNADAGGRSAARTHGAFLFVNQGESPATVQSFLQQQGFTLREVLLDSGSSLGQAIASRGLPITLFFDAKGRQVDAHFGILNPAALESRLRQLRTAPR